MSKFLIIYMGCWVTAFLIAMGILIGRFNCFDIARLNYWQLLLQPWKVITFLIATLGLVLIAPYTGDATWDYYDATFMAVLTYITAPWTVAVLYKAIKGQRVWWQAYVVACV